MALIHAAAFPPGERWSATALGLQLSMPGAFGWIDPTCGFVLARVAADEAEILTLAVLPAGQQQGRGRVLLGAAIAEATRRGACALLLEVAVGNAAACALYTRAGFSEVGRRPRYYASRQDALVLRCPLQDARR